MFIDVITDNFIAYREYTTMADREEYLELDSPKASFSDDIQFLGKFRPIGNRIFAMIPPDDSDDDGCKYPFPFSSFLKRHINLQVLINYLLCLDGPLDGIGQCVVTVINPWTFNIVHAFSY